MAVTSIHPIRTTLNKSIQYIVDGNKTRNGKFVISSGCVSDVQQATEQFMRVRACGTGRSTVLAQHIIQSFSPEEITPEKALLLGTELCEKLFGNEYQYILATHTDHDHIHNHIIFNNVNMFTGRTFETEYNQGKKSERAWAKLRKTSDDLCRKHCLSVIENPEMNKGKTHYEWDMSNKNASWKSKLKYEIDQVIKIAVDFEDFLIKCGQRNIEVEYNPDNKIDLKFRLEGQQRFTRAKTLGWYYETPQIKKRIEMYKAVMSYTPTVKIIRTDTEKMQNSYGLRKWADIQNMKNASKVINILTKHGVEDSIDLENKCLSGMTVKGVLTGKLETLNKEIKLLKKKRECAFTVKKNKPVIDEKKTLSGRKLKKYESAHYTEITEYHSVVQKLKGWYPDMRVPSVSYFDKMIGEKTEEYNSLYKKYAEVNERNKELDYCRQQLEIYLSQERVKSRQKEKNNALE